MPADTNLGQFTPFTYRWLPFGTILFTFASDMRYEVVKRKGGTGYPRRGRNPMNAHSCRLMVLLGVLLVPAASWAAAKTCLTGTAPEVASDPSQIAAVRAAIDSTCPCANFDGSAGKTRGNYIACVNNVIKTQVLSSALRTKCKSTVKKYYANSTCGLGASARRVPCIRKRQ